MWIMAIFGKHLVTSAVVRSNPGVFFNRYFSIEYLRSFGVKVLIGRVKESIHGIIVLSKLETSE